MTSTVGGEGGVGGDADRVREVAWICSIDQLPNADKGGRVSKNPETLWMSLMDVRLLTRVDRRHVSAQMLRKMATESARSHVLARVDGRRGVLRREEGG